MGDLVVIRGPYCAGKSTELRRRAEQLHAEGREPICIDYDDLAQALGSTRSHGHSDPITALTVRLRGLAIKAALELHRDTGVDVLIVDASPTPSRLQQYQQAGAEIVTLDVPVDELHRRAAAERPPEWHRYIDEWTPIREEPRKVWPKRPAYRKGAHGHRYERLRAIFLDGRTNCDECGQPFVTDAPCEHRACRSKRSGGGCHFFPAYPTVDHTVRLVDGGPSLDVSTWRAVCLRCNESDGGKVGRARQLARAQANSGTVDLSW